MKRTLARAAIATACMLGFAGGAQAIPMYFDFTGQIVGGTLASAEGLARNSPISGGFTFETDRLVESLPLPTVRSWADRNPSGLTDPLAYLDFGGRDSSPEAWRGFATFTLTDGCAPDCGGYGYDMLSLFVSSTDRDLTPGFTGTLQRSFFYLASTGIDYPPGGLPQYFNYFDLLPASPESMVNLPLHSLYGSYNEEVLSCVAGTCTSNGRLGFNFSVDSATRGFGVRNLPEPDTLGLLVAGLLAALLVRRRAPTRQRA